jgi:hypothetical protein
LNLTFDLIDIALGLETLVAEGAPASLILAFSDPPIAETLPPFGLTFPAI